MDRAKRERLEAKGWKVGTVSEFSELTPDVFQLLKENPSLKPYLEEALQIAYTKGMALAAGEANLPLRTFPENCPYSLEEILSDRFYPGAVMCDELMQ